MVLVGGTFGLEFFGLAERQQTRPDEEIATYR